MAKSHKKRKKSVHAEVLGQTSTTFRKLDPQSTIHNVQYLIGYLL